MHTHTQAIEKHEKLTNKPTKKQTRGRKEKRHDLNLITQKNKIREGKSNTEKKINTRQNEEKNPERNKLKEKCMKAVVKKDMYKKNKINK